MSAAYNVSTPPDKTVTIGTDVNLGSRPIDAVIFKAEDTELLEIVRYVAYRYTKAISGYQNVANVVTDENCREIFIALADRKQTAADILHEKYGVEVAVVVGGACNAVTRYILDVDFQPITLLGEAFTYAFHRELAEIRLLEQVSRRQHQSILKRFLIGQIAVCKRHVRLLEDDFSRLAVSNGTWM